MAEVFADIARKRTKESFVPIPSSEERHKGNVFRWTPFFVSPDFAVVSENTTLWEKQTGKYDIVACCPGQTFLKEIPFYPFGFEERSVLIDIIGITYYRDKDLKDFFLSSNNSVFSEEVEVGRKTVTVSCVTVNNPGFFPFWIHMKWNEL